MRKLDAATLAACRAPTVRPVMMVDLDFETGARRLHHWVGDIDAVDPFTSELLTFSGIGDLGSIGVIEQPEDLRATDLTLQMTGIDPAYVATAMGEDYQGRAAKIHLGFLAADHAALVSTAVIPIARGKINHMLIELGETATITVNLRNELYDWERPRGGRYSDAEQQRRYPGDTAFKRVAAAAVGEIVWKSA